MILAGIIKTKLKLKIIIIKLKMKNSSGVISKKVAKNKINKKIKMKKLRILNKKLNKRNNLLVTNKSK